MHEVSMRGCEEGVRAVIDTSNDTKRKRLLAVTALLCVLSIGVMAIALVQPVDSVDGGFVAPPFDSGAIEGVPVVGDGLGWSEIETPEYKLSVCGVLVLPETTKGNGVKADVWFTNPDANEVWLKLRVLDSDGGVLGETGLLKPGEFVQSIELWSLPAEGDAVVFKVMAYQPETYYSEGSVGLKAAVLKERGQ